MSDESSKERDILMVMRKVLAAIIKDVTPEHRSLQHPLSEQTIEDIRMCFGLITAREKELADDAGRTVVERPHFTDEVRSSSVVSMHSIGRIKKNPDEPKE